MEYTKILQTTLKFLKDDVSAFYSSLVKDRYVLYSQHSPVSSLATSFSGSLEPKHIVKIKLLQGIIHMESDFMYIGIGTSMYSRTSVA